MAHIMLSNSVNRKCLKWIQDNLSTTNDTTCGLQLKDMVHSFLMDTSIDIEPNTFAKILHHQFHGQFKKCRLGSRRIIHYMGLKCLQPPSKSKGTCDVPKDGREQVEMNASVASSTSSTSVCTESSQAGLKCLQPPSNSKGICDVPKADCTDVEEDPSPCSGSSVDGREQVEMNASVASSTSSTSVCTESSQAHLPPFVDASTDSQETLSEASNSSRIKTLDDNTNLNNERVFIYEVGMTKEKVAFLQKFIPSKGGARVMFLDINTTCIAFDKNGILASLTPQRDFDKLCNFGKRLLDTSFFNISLLSNSEQPSQAESKQPNTITTLKSPFIKVEDTSGKYRPLYKEFSNREWKTCTSLSFLCPNEKNPSSVTCMKAGDIKRKCPSYCECCDELYYDLTSHLHSEKHRAFLRNQDNFEKLDECINKQPLSAWLASL